MIYIGNHLSSSGGFFSMGIAEKALGGNTFAFFTRNPRGGSAKEIDPDDVKKLRDFLDENSFGPLVAHAPYTMNLCSDKSGIRDFASNILGDDLKRMEYLPGHYYNLHPGSHVGQGTENAVDMIADALNRTMFPEMQTTVLLETMSGKGSEVGGSFEELKMIIDRLKYPEHVGICFDTCHTWDSGYDIVGDLEGVLDSFDRIIGLDSLKAVHLNDSMNPLGAKKDRHQKLGQGQIGAEGLKNVVCNPRLQGLPFILETPNDDPGYAREIRTVITWCSE